jgi:hypothetical protein
MWERGALPESVQRLVATHVDSLDVMQVLLLLHDHPDRTWTSQEATEVLGLDAASVSGALVRLRQRGFLTVELAGDTRYRYAPKGDLGSAVDDLKECYRARPIDLAALIAARPQQRLRLFADAFRLRKDD